MEQQETLTAKLNVHVPKKMYIDLKMIAAKEEKTITQIVIECLEKYVKSSKDKIMFSD